MTATLKHRILEFLINDPTTLCSISDIARKLGVAYSHAHTFVTGLSKEGVIDINKIGNVSVCRLNLKQPLTLSYLSLIESRRALEWSRKNPQSAKIMERVEQVKDNVHCVLIKGSRVIIIVPEHVTGADFSIFKNRSVLTHAKLSKNRKQYHDCIVLHGAEKFWGMMAE